MPAPLPPSAPDSETNGPLALAVRRVLRPLVRLLLSQRLGYPWLCDVLRELYVEVADREFQLDGKAQTDSRISLLTGVHRKSVRDLRAPGRSTQVETPPAISLGAQLVARWVSDPAYTDENGIPLPLPRLASQGGGLSFEALVASVSKDIRARAVLDEWLRLGVVRIDGEHVILNAEAFVPARGFEEKVFYFGQNLHDHLAAAASNVMGTAPAFLERSVHYDGLRPESVATLAAASEEAGMRALKDINRRAAGLARRDTGVPTARHRLNFGIYFYTEPMHIEESATTAPRPQATE